MPPIVTRRLFASLAMCAVIFLFGCSREEQGPTLEDFIDGVDHSDQSDGGSNFTQAQYEERERALAALSWAPPLAGRTLLDAWGGTGVITTPIGTVDDVVRATAYQSDGKLVVAGRVYNGTYNEFLVARYLPDGSLDSTFDSDGFARIDFPGGEALAHSVAIDSLGRIVVAGRVWGLSNYDFGITRLNTDGAVDSTFFSSSGRRIINIGGAEFARDVAVDSFGRIVVAGYSNVAGNYDFAMARMLSDGTLDPGFNVSGLQTTAIGTAWDIAYSLAIDSTDRPVVVGLSQSAGQYDFALVRYRSNGTLDSAFSTDGKDTWAIGTGDDLAWTVAIHSTAQYYVGGRSRNGANYNMALAVWGTDGTHVKSGTFAAATGAVARGISLDDEGRILLGGRSWNGTNWDFALARIKDQEGLNATFSTDGIAIASAGTRDDLAYAIALQADGKVVVAGPTRNATNEDFAVMRFTTAGVLDTTYSGDGIVTTAVGTSDDIPYSVIIQGDGKAVVGGLSRVGTRSIVALTRYTTAGALDTTFSGDGIQITTVGSGNGVANSLALQTDGKVVFGGTLYNGANNDMFLGRYLTNGTIDTTFGVGGIRTLAIGTVDDSGNAVAIQGNGRIVIAGQSNFASRHRFAAARVLTNGAIDSTFDTDGLWNSAVGTSGDDGAYAVSILTDGKILLGGQAHGIAGKDFALARLLTTGALDTGFSGDGLATASVHTDGGQLNGMAIFTDGKILGVGRTIELRNAFIITKFLTSGALDTTFDGDGVLALDISTGDDIAYGAAINASGAVYAAGATRSATKYNFVVVSLGGFGLPDSTFDGDGFAITAVGTNDDVGLALATQSGKIVLAGDSVRSGFYDLALVRYDSNGALASGGSLDRNFSVDGMLTQAIGTADDIAYAVAVDSSGRIFAGGFTRNGATNDFAIAKFTAGGALDTTFNTTGLVTTAISTGNDSIAALLIQPDGKLVAVGQAFNGGNWDFALTRYLTSGALDTTFDGDGRVITAIGTLDNMAHGAALDGSNRLVVAGSRLAASQNAFAIARYNTNGALDSTFGTAGIVTTSLTTANTDDIAYAVAIQQDGKIVVGGHSHQTAGKYFAFARYLTNGSLDTSFSGDGLQLISVDTDGADLYALALETGGRIVAAGRAFGLQDAAAMARLLTDGSLDTTFGTGGVTTLGLTTADDVVFGMALTGNGKAVIAGFSNKNANPDFTIARVLRGGTVDTAFGNGGVTVSTIGNREDIAYAMAVAPDGRLVVVGSSNNGTNHDFAVMRYWP